MVYLTLNTETKLFCSCSTKADVEPNTNVCPVCLGLPGALPQLNKKVLEYAVAISKLLNCSINQKSRIDRRNSFYLGSATNYHINQYELPVAENGYINIPGDKIKRIVIKKISIGENPAKLVYLENSALLDYNSSGIPIIEIEAEINDFEEAKLYFKELERKLQPFGVVSFKKDTGFTEFSSLPEGDVPIINLYEISNKNSII